MKTQVTKELLFNYFAGRTTTFQKQLIDEWAKDPVNREQFFSWLELWESQNPQYVADVQTAMKRHQQRMARKPESNEGTEIEMPVPQHRWYRWIAVASVALLVMGGWMYRDTLLNETYTTAYGQTRRLMLADGSEVTLNANSRLKVPRFGFGSQTRDVELSGEATFSVTHTVDNQRFVVKTARNFEVVVLGTEFSVYNRERGGRVVLNKGKVQLRYQEGPSPRQLTMKPGDLVTLNRRNGPVQLRKLHQPENLSAWRENRFVFEETTLEEITHLFRENYGLELEITDPALAQWTVSGSFTAHNAEELLESLMEGSALTYQRTGNQIVITEPAN
ncbi:FecR family protein [Larkinella arboricola]|uniref:FecR family protein n=1 Tax=Larkinella arboricola TaxID=643671 RepID=A0A327WMX8_LARAB|nr:FecR domain-containing protein [Larkinella arboricola]RAJ93041.1 FecR family protein [Larkinella arboricola]